MAKTYWFRVQTSGWVWYPSSWQGWLVLACYAWFVIWDYQRVASENQLVGYRLANFLPDFAILTALLIFICFRTGEKPRWHWGK